MKSLKINFLQKPKEVEDEEKRERNEDEGAEEENAEELEMKDAVFGDENMEPPGKTFTVWNDHCKHALGFSRAPGYGTLVFSKWNPKNWPVSWENRKGFYKITVKCQNLNYVVRFSDDSLLAQFQTVWYLDNSTIHTKNFRFWM